MEKLSQDYQEERPNLESADLTIIVICALREIVDLALEARRDTWDTKDTNSEGSSWAITTAEIREKVLSIIKDSEISIDTDKISTDRVGRVLGRLRFTRPPKDGSKKLREWRVYEAEVARHLLSYGLPPITAEDHSVPSVPNDETTIKNEQGNADTLSLSAAFQK
jgi:hypothetical protein